MPPIPPPSGSSRSSAAVNADIRALWERSPAGLSEEDRAEYQRLLAEWSAAKRGEIGKAA